MPIEHVVRNLLDGPEQVILHGCNARGFFGAGVAKAIADTHPRARDAYMRAWKQGKLTPGVITWSSSGVWRIGNAITQDRYGRDPNVRYVIPEALRQCIRAMDVLAQRSHSETIISSWFGGAVDRVAMPRIGSGLGGGNWEEMEAIIREEAKNFSAVICSLPGVTE